jgi:hypothetical protein
MWEALCVTCAEPRHYPQGGGRRLACSLRGVRPRLDDLMSPAVVKLVAMLLLVVQGVIASASGRVLCIPLPHCDAHEQDHTGSGGHCEGAACHDEPSTDCDEQTGHVPCTILTPMSDECDCHVHVQVPGDESVPSKSKADSGEVRVLLVPVIVAIVMTVELAPPASSVFRPPPRDIVAIDQTIALKTTRLLI